MTNVRPRTEARQHFDGDGRMTLLEADADVFEREIDALESKLDRILWTNVSIVITLATATAMLGLNLMVSR